MFALRGPLWFARVGCDRVATLCLRFFMFVGWFARRRSYKTTSKSAPRWASWSVCLVRLVFASVFAGFAGPAVQLYRHAAHQRDDWTTHCVRRLLPTCEVLGWRCLVPSCHLGPLRGLEAAAWLLWLACGLPRRLVVGAVGAATPAAPCAWRLCPAWWGYAPPPSALEACHARMAHHLYFLHV